MNLAIYLTFSLLLLLILPLYILLVRKKSKKVPPGSLGWPIIGHSLSFLHAMHSNTIELWLQERVTKFGHISKLSLFGTPTVFLHGQAANKFIFTSTDGDTLTTQQTPSFRRIFGKRNMTELTGDDHKRVRGALMSFLKPDILKMYVGRMDEEVQKHLKMHWHGNDKIGVMPLMKTLTFNIMSSLIFGLQEGATRDAVVRLLQGMMDGALAIPINLPFTRYGRGLKASAKIRTMIMDLIREKKAALKQHRADPNQDLITCLLSIRNEDSSMLLSDEEIVDNTIGVMVAGHDTSSVLITFLVRILACNQSVYAAIVQEQEEIAMSKTSGDVLTWDDLAKMKYTWRVALETLRMYPPLLGSFRRVLKDFEYEGYTIPKGWNVIWAACMTHMEESYFPCPSEFDPTRFEKQTSALPYSFVAFGGGSRICPGNEFARVETLVTIHYLVTQFKWKLRCMDTSFSRNPFPVFKQGLQIQIEPK